MPVQAPAQLKGMTEGWNNGSLEDWEGTRLFIFCHYSVIPVFHHSSLPAALLQKAKNFFS
jgi:hypothetical protein